MDPTAGSSTRINNFLEEASIPAQSTIKNLIVLKTFLGYNHLYLIRCRSVYYVISYIYTCFLFSISIWHLIFESAFSATMQVYKRNIFFQYLALTLFSVFVQKDRLKSFFENLKEFDDEAIIKIKFELYPRLLNLVTIPIVLVNYLIEVFCLMIIFPMNFATTVSMFVVVLLSVSHDIEIIFINSLLYMIYKRVQILRNLVFSHFDDSNKIFMLEYAKQGPSFLFTLYDDLHKCSDALNEALRFSLSVLFATSVLSTVTNIKTISLVFARSGELATNLFWFALFASCSRIIRYSLHVVLICFTTRLITDQVTSIRIKIQSELDNTQPLVYRRQLKALFQLTRNKEFTYNLLGNIKIDMKLPLRYIGLCITYVIILLQFSKIVD